MRGGDSAKPTALKILTGNPGKRVIPVGEPVPPTANSLEPPPNLSERASWWWKHYVSFLHPLGLLTVADLGSLERLCNVDARLDEMDRNFNENGFLTDDGNGGKTVKNVTAYAGLYAARNQLMTHFGLSPASRARLGHKPQQNTDPFEEFTKRKAGRPRKLA